MKNANYEIHFHSGFMEKLDWKFQLFFIDKLMASSVVFFVTMEPQNVALMIVLLE